MDNPPSLQEQRDARIAELERSLARAPRRGVKPFTAVAGILASLILLGMLRLPLGYHFSPREPLLLGSEGQYDFATLTSNRYAEIHGTPTLRGAYEQQGETVYVLVGLQGTPVLVRRAALPGETLTPGRPPPQPDQRSFRVRGRLLVEDDAPRLKDGFRRLREMGEVVPRDGKLWVLYESERPGEDPTALLAAGALVAFIALNVWLLLRRYRKGG